jgi:hypothetical protein
MEHPLTGIFAAAPSVVRVGEPFRIGVKLLTEPYEAPSTAYTPIPGMAGRYNLSPRGITYMDNVVPEWVGTVAIDGGEGYTGPTSIAFEERPKRYGHDRRPIRRVEGLRFETPGLRFLTLREPTSGIAQRSNAIDVVADEPAERLWWGDIHSQTYFTDGLRCPEELYAFARDEAFLDIFALSDHAEHLTDRQWDYFVAVTNDCNAPGEFATLVGLEWTSHKWGHRNVYYPGDGGPILRSTDPAFADTPSIYRVAHEHGALVIPHHSANVTMGVDWSLGHDPDVERLVEIHSVWGNSERPAEAGNPLPIRTLGGEKAGQHVVDALARGYRLGFTGGGDIHDGRPGDELHNRQLKPEQYRLLPRQGIMGVWAPELTREAIFEALWNRRVFATTNVRVLLRFSVAGQPMGSEARASGTIPIHAYAASEVPIARADLVRNGADIQTLEPHACELDWQTTDEPTEFPAYYYVRLTRTDGNLAWSSPVWVDPA